MISLIFRAVPRVGPTRSVSSRKDPLLGLHPFCFRSKAMFCRPMRIACVAIFVSLFPLQLPADVILPTLSQIQTADPGATSYQIAFVTSGGTTGISSDITVYNNFVTSEAALSSSLPGSVTWNAIVSTPTTNACDNAPTYASVPIFNTAGQLVAAGSSQLWSGTEIENAIAFDQNGNPAQGLSYGNNGNGPWVWSGTDPYGFAVPGYAMGQFNLGPSQNGGESTPEIGDWSLITYGGQQYPANWIDAGPMYSVSGYAEWGEGQIYALSSPITAVPEPATLTLLGSALLGLGVVCLRQRATRTAKRSAFDQQDAPAILFFPSHSSTAHAARRAA